MDPKIEQLQKRVMTEKPEKADAIVWLQGDGYSRGAKVLELYRAGLAPLIVVTGNNVRVVEDDQVKVVDIVRWLQEQDIGPAVIVCDDQSMHTLDQAYWIMTMAKERGWQRLLLVGSTHHQLRAFLTFLFQAKHHGWDGRIINQPVFIDWDTKPSGRRKTTRQAFVEEIVKLEHYQDTLATTEEGLAYLQHA